MNVTLCVTYDSINKINKRVDAVSSPISCTIKQDTSLINPIISITLPDNIRWHDFNFVIFENGYSYMVVDVTKKMGGVYDISLEIDVLFTFKKEINSLVIDVIRSESDGNENILDTDVPLITSRIVESQNIGAFNPLEYKYYLCVSGG